MLLRKSCDPALIGHILIPFLRIAAGIISPPSDAAK
jgi:hypothetical protein